MFAREDDCKSRREVVDEIELAKGIIVPKIASQPPGIEGYEAYASILLMKYAYTNAHSYAPSIFFFVSEDHAKLGYTAARI